jgi:hypothetical protein
MLNKEEKSRNFFLHNFDEKPGFSLSMREKQLKFESTTTNLVIYN